MAPALKAFWILIEKLHSPRRMNASRPWIVLGANGEHAEPVPSSVWTSSNSAGPIVPATAGPFPGSAPTFSRSTGGDGETIASGFAKNREFVVAPAVIACGEIPGLLTVPVPGPSFPAATTTVTPASSAVCTASAMGSRSGGLSAGAPKLRLTMSIPSRTASSMALMMGLS